jgi:steroid delta-isomerase-like uncharacterized protein
MTNEEITAFIGRHTDDWNRHDPEALSLDHAEDGVIVSPMFARVEGRAQIRATYAALFEVFPDWRITLDLPPIIDGTRLAVYFSVVATQHGEFMGHAGTGQGCAFHGVSLFELSPDLHISEERRFYDFTGLLTQLGVLRVRPH